MTITAGDVGGSFGMKGGLYPEVPLVVWASKKVGRPVKWTCERSEGHVADDQARDMHVEGTLALDDNGKFLGLRLVSNNNVGAFITMIGFLSTNGIASAVTGPILLPRFTVWVGLCLLILCQFPIIERTAELHQLM